MERWAHIHIIIIWRNVHTDISFAYSHSSRSVYKFRFNDTQNNVNFYQYKARCECHIYFSATPVAISIMYVYVCIRQVSQSVGLCQLRDANCFNVLFQNFHKQSCQVISFLAFCRVYSTAINSVRANVLQ